MRRCSFLAPLVLSISSVAVAGNTPGTWPTYAHDFQRTARADGVGHMHNPQIAWSAQLGAALAPNEVLAADLDQQGRSQVATISGGRVVVSRADGTTIWKSSLDDGARSILGAWNLDGHGALELVVQTSHGVLVYDGASGSVDATFYDEGLLGATFVPEGPAGGILVISSSRGALHAYDFRSSTWPSGPSWTGTGANPNEYLVADVDGDGAVDLVRPLESGFDVLDPLTGKTRYGPVALGDPAYTYEVQVADVDNVPGAEIVAVDPSIQYSPSAGIYVLGVRAGVLSVLWSSSVSSKLALATDFYMVAGSVCDLDNDGRPEVVYSRWDSGSSTWSTYVADGATGTAVAALDGEIIQAVADLDGDGKRELVVRGSPTADRTPIHSTLRVFDFDSRTSGPVAKSWSVDAARVVLLASGQRSPSTAYLDAPAFADFDGAFNGEELLLGREFPKATSDTSFDILRGDGSIAFSETIASPLNLSAIAVTDHLTSATSRDDLLLFSNDGTLLVDDSTLVARSSFGAGSYSVPPYVAGVSSTESVVFAQNSVAELLWLDGTHLHGDGSPYVLNRTPDTVPASSWAAGGFAFDPVVSLSGSTPTFVTYEARDGRASAVVAHDSMGVEVWRHPLAQGTQIWSPASYSHDFTGDGVDDLVLTTANVNSLESLSIYDGVDGHLVRSTPLASIAPQADELSQGSLVDVDGDGLPEIVGHIHDFGTVAIDLSASPMTALWSIPNSAADYLLGTIIAAPFDTAPGVDLVRAGGNNGFGVYARLGLAGVVEASRDEGLPMSPNADENHPALIGVNGQSRFDIGWVGMADPFLSRVRRIDGTTLDVIWEEYAADGVISSTPPPTAFALHDPLTLDVDGDGQEDLVFGGDDGWIYAIRTSDGSSVFATNVGAPVRYLIAADIDLDPELELVASLSDGRLIALDDPGQYTAPTDTPDAGAPDGGSDGGSTTGPHGHDGCGCGAVGESRAASGDAIGGVLLGLAVFMRRRRLRGTHRACRGDESSRS